MFEHCNDLPQMNGHLFLADGGLETTLIFDEGVDLPHFAAFDLMRNERGAETLRRYFERYVEIARKNGRGIVLESPTWRANRDWAQRLGYDAESLAHANRKAIELLLQIRATQKPPAIRIVVSGNIGPRGDGYRADSRMTARAARTYHAPQIETFAETGADMVAAFTMNYVEEAIGIADAARDAGIPAAISFTVETDGRLPSGVSLGEAIKRTDDGTGGYPAYYMINCAHPAHFEHVLREGGAWRERVRGLRANASRRSHAELDESTDLDAGNPQELAAHYREMAALLPHLTVVGGCCGTDHRHVEAIASAFAGAPTDAAAA